MSPFVRRGDIFRKFVYHFHQVNLVKGYIFQVVIVQYHKLGMNPATSASKATELHQIKYQTEFKSIKIREWPGDGGYGA